MITPLVLFWFALGIAQTALRIVWHRWGAEAALNWQQVAILTMFQYVAGTAVCLLFLWMGAIMAQFMNTLFPLIG